MINKEQLKVALAEYEERLKSPKSTHHEKVLKHYINITNELLETKD